MTATPRLIALATAVPAHEIRQDSAAETARAIFDPATSEVERLQPAYAHAGVATRQSVLNLDWFARRHGWKERHAIFLPNALALLEQAAARCLERAGLEASAVDVLVISCTSGVTTPSLDALLLDRLPFRRDVERMPLFGFGCAGGVLGLARAAAMAQATPGRRVLFLSVELCSLTFRPQDQSKANIIATALFGDGAAAALLTADEEPSGPRLSAWGEWTWPHSESVMGWEIEDDGFGVRFSPEIPRIVRRDLGPALDNFLSRIGLARADIDGYLAHPGGEKVLGALERVLALPPGALKFSRAVLSEHGNMSGSTVLFVVERALAAGVFGRQMMLSFGPGFTAAFLLLEIAPLRADGRHP